MNLINSFGRRGVQLGLLTRKVGVEDTEYLSKYFVVSEYNTKFTPGKNSVSFNGSTFLKQNSEIQVECLDAGGNSLYVELARTQDTIYKESTSFVVSIYVYGDSVSGQGKLILVGTTNSNKSVRWVSNITIDKSIYNTSKVRFYSRPTLEVKPVQSPVLDTSTSRNLSKQVVLTGSFHTYAVKPNKDTSKTYINQNTVEIDYRLQQDDVKTGGDPSSSINSQLNGFTATLYVEKIQKPFSYTTLDVNTTESFLVKDVVNKSSFKLNDAYYYEDATKTRIVTNISSGRFSITYPYISYNTGSGNYLTIGGSTNPITVYQSYAEITYRNLKTFTGYIARHKLYRRSLYSSGDFETVADEPLQSKELLEDSLTLNKAFNKMGRFYNQYHINRYWFSNDANVGLTHNDTSVIDGVEITSSGYSSLNGNKYIIVKNDSVNQNRNSTYLPYNEEEYNITSGSSYDCNFIELRNSVQYVLSTDLIIRKNKSTKTAKVEFYLTSSTSGAAKEKTFSTKYGVKIGEVAFAEMESRKIYSEDNRVNILYTPQNDMYGTLVIVPNDCFITLSDLSFKAYGDDGFSPEILTTRVSFPISIPNESFEIKAELFDINSNLVYSELRTIQAFDPSGSTLNIYIPGYSDATTQIPGDLFISGSLTVRGNVNISGSALNFLDMPSCPSPTYVIGYNLDGTICYTPYPTVGPGGDGNAGYDDNYLYVEKAISASAVRVQGEVRIDNAI